MDPYVDVAVLEVDAQDRRHPVAPLACGDSLGIGEPIGAFGHPLGLRFTGSRGKTMVSRLIGSLMRLHGLNVAVAGSDGLYLGQRRMDKGDCANWKSAQRVLMNRAVEAAVLEAGYRSILAPPTFAYCLLADSPPLTAQSPTATTHFGSGVAALAATLGGARRRGDDERRPARAPAAVAAGSRFGDEVLSR